MKARNMFKDLGFKLIRSDDDYLVYEKEVGQGVKKVVSFCEQLQDVLVSFEDIISEQTPSISMTLLMAINQQSTELGWLK